VTQRRIVLIGFGNMGQALVRGWLARGVVPAEAIRVVDPSVDARRVASELGVRAAETLTGVVDAGASPDVVLLAVKPQQMSAALEACRASIAPGAVFLSIAAGKTLGQLAAGLGERAIVRAMPNTPAAVGQGMTALVANTAVTEAQRALCTELLSAVGAVAWLDDEAQMDAVTAVSGSGPAYVFLLIECLEHAAIRAGLGPALARQLAIETVAGAGVYARSAQEPPAELRRRVTSPGGTTQAALGVLMGSPGLEELVDAAVAAAARRSRELSAG
jgi:pyrroline-5-carboxylate reductase